jgi:hypothetical protein
MQQGLEFKDVLKERLEIDYTKRAVQMIPSNFYRIYKDYREFSELLKYVLTLRFDN